MSEVSQRVAPTPEISGNQPTEIGRGAWLALAAALLGWMFDGAEMGIFSMVGRSAVQDLMRDQLVQLQPQQQESLIGLWFGVITAGFLVGAATGGVVFGWLGDRIGRVRAMTLSVLTYALFTGLCGFAAEAWQVGVLRFIAALGMGGEWSLGVALVMEVWPNRSRAFMAGLIGAAANVGYMIVGFVGLVLAEWLQSVEGWLTSAGFADSTVQMLVAHKGWRLMMMLGTLPAGLTFFIRMFVPESDKWQHEQDKGTTSHWATQDLLAVLIGVIGPALIVYAWAFEQTGGMEHSAGLRIAATVLGLAIATIGYTYPVIRFFQRQAAFDVRTKDWQPVLKLMLMGACLSGVALLGTWGSTQWAPTFADKLAESERTARAAVLEEGGELEAAAAVRAESRRAREWTLIWISIGAIVGTLLAAMMGDLMGRRAAYFTLCALSLASVYIFYLGQNEYGNWFLFWAFIAGTFTASFYGWLPLYLPELFPTSMRATGQGFSFNFGRILAAIGVLQTGNLMGLFQSDLYVGGFTIPHGYPLACSTMSLIYVVGMVLIWFVPETRGKPLPE